MRTAFVASTLPALFIKKNYKKLNLGAIICANKDLLKSYSFLIEMDKNITLIGLKNYDELKKYSQSIYFKNIIIFHECCWLELDILIIKYKPIVKYYPCVTLDSFILLDSKDKNIFILFFTFISTLDKKILKLIYFIIRYSFSFDIYKMRIDGSNEKFDYVTSLKTDLFNNITKDESCFECRKKISLASKEGKTNSKIVIFIVATDVIDNNLQLEKFKKLKNICETKGLKVLFKNHPNQNFRLPYPENWDSISPFEPFETLEIDYLFKIGLFSTALAFEPNKSISISEMFDINDQNFEKRKDHNNSLVNNNQILNPKSVEEFEKIVINFINSNSKNA